MMGKKNDELIFTTDWSDSHVYEWYMNLLIFLAGDELDDNQWPPKNDD